MEQKGEAMTTARELLQEARDYLASSDEVNARCLAEDIHAFLAQPEPELVAWLKGTRICISIESDESMLQDGWTPLYAAQPEPSAPAYCPIHQHYKWCEHNGGVLGETGYGPAAKPEPSAEVERIMALLEGALDQVACRSGDDKVKALRAEVERLVQERDRLDHAVRDAIREHLFQRERAEKAEAECARLRAGGCARDQGLTQYCAEALKFSNECERLRKAFDAMVMVTPQGQPCYRTGNGIPMGMPRTTEKIVRAAIDAALQDKTT